MTSPSDVGFIKEKRALATATAIASIPTTYAALRAFEHLNGVNVDPAHVFFVDRSGYFVRLALAIFVAGMVGATAFLASRERLSTFVTWAVPLAAASIVACALFFP